MKTENAPSTQNNSGCLLRLYWMLFGNVAILACGAMIAKTGNIILYGSIYLALLASLITARHVDIRYCKGYKADDSGPATEEDWRKYSFIVIAVYLSILIALIAFKLKS